jgi:hypothetical protein
LKQRVFPNNLVVVEVFVAEGLTEDTLGELGEVIAITPSLTSS